MGTGIAIVANKVAGLKVKLVDAYDESLSKSRKFTEQWLEKEISKNRLTSEERYSVLERFSYFTNIDELNDVDFVVEAISEDFDLKKKIF